MIKGVEFSKRLTKSLKRAVEIRNEKARQEYITAMDTIKHKYVNLIIATSNEAKKQKIIKDFWKESYEAFSKYDQVIGRDSNALDMALFTSKDKASEQQQYEELIPVEYKLASGDIPIDGIIPIIN